MALQKHNPEAGLAALKMVEMTDQDDALLLLNELRDFAIFTPNTPTLRGTLADSQQRQPVGLAGGQLANAVSNLDRFRTATKANKDSSDREAFIAKVRANALQHRA